jgi:hypothetical protein
MNGLSQNAMPIVTEVFEKNGGFMVGHGQKFDPPWRV